MSSAMPPDGEPPELQARAHTLLKERPELLSAVVAAEDLDILPMTEADAQDLTDLESELFPATSCAGLEKNLERLAEPGILALKACLPGDASRCPVAFLVVAGSRGAIEACTTPATMESLRTQITIPRQVPFDTPSRRELAYIISLGVVAELRRRGLAEHLVRRGVEDLRAQAAAVPGGTGLRAVALDVIGYNTAAIRCYEACGFKCINVDFQCYGMERGYLYIFSGDEGNEGDAEGRHDAHARGR